MTLDLYDCLTIPDNPALADLAKRIDSLEHYLGINGRSENDPTLRSLAIRLAYINQDIASRISSNGSSNYTIILPNGITTVKDLAEKIALIANQIRELQP